MKLKKDELLQRWENTPDGQDILSVMKPLHHKHTGKTFGLDGIRIDGSEEFIFAVLSRLKDLIDGENHTTRLQASFMDCEEAKGEFNKGNGGHCVYVRLVMRSDLGSATSAFFEKGLTGRTERFARSKGITA